MEPPIPSVAPPKQGEVTSKTVWPSIAAFRAGRLVGRLGGVQVGIGRFFTLGKLFALATIPLALLLYFWRVFPFVCRRYRLTNRRIVVQKGLKAVDERAIGLDEFDGVQVEHLPGQTWLRAGEIIFTKDGAEVFRLSGVTRPEIFAQVCLEARTALISVREVLQQQAIGSRQ